MLFVKVYKAVVLLTLLLALPILAMAQNNDLKNKRVLVYTKNGKGYVHDNTTATARCIQKLGADNGFKVDTTSNPSVFTEANLKQYTLLIFGSTNNEVFDTDAQRVAFRRYIEAGGGFVGIHSAVGTERNWTWFKQLLGGSFAWHPPHQKYTVRVIDPSHPTTEKLPASWQPALGDECYFLKEFYPGIKVTAVHDISTLNQRDSVTIRKNAGSFGSLIPAEWYQRFDGGNIWISTLGHDKEYYSRPDFADHILDGIKYIASLSTGLDYTKAYATNKNTPVDYYRSSPQKH